MDGPQQGGPGLIVEGDDDRGGGQTTVIELLASASEASGCGRRGRRTQKKTEARANCDKTVRFFLMTPIWIKMSNKWRRRRITEQRRQTTETNGAETREELCRTMIKVASSIST